MFDLHHKTTITTRSSIFFPSFLQKIKRRVSFTDTLMPRQSTPNSSLLGRCWTKPEPNVPQDISSPWTKGPTTKPPGTPRCPRILSTALGDYHENLCNGKPYCPMKQPSQNAGFWTPLFEVMRIHMINPI